MPRLSASQVLAYAMGAGLSGDSALIATAIAGWDGSPSPGESGGNTEAIGDVSLEDAKWGPSVGLWQIRSVRAEKGRGTTRDYSKLMDPSFNAKSMYSISGGGNNWTPWSIYNAGMHTENLAALRSMSRGGTLPIAQGSSELLSNIPNEGWWRRAGFVLAGLFMVIVGFVFLSATFADRVSNVIPQARAIKKVAHGS